MSHQEKEVARNLFPGKLSKQVQSQFTQFARTDMTAYTFSKAKSHFRSARTDLSVFNLEGRLVLHGRDFGDRIFFWQPLPIA